MNIAHTKSKRQMFLTLGRQIHQLIIWEASHGENIVYFMDAEALKTIMSSQNSKQFTVFNDNFVNPEMHEGAYNFSGTIFELKKILKKILKREIELIARYEY